MKESDWLHFDIHADYVKELTFQSTIDGQSDLCPDVSWLIDLSLRNGQHPGPFMRRLRTIHCIEADTDYLWIVHPFIGPSLTVFSMKAFQEYDSTDLSFASLKLLDVLRIRSPFLQELTITMPGPQSLDEDPRLTAALSRLVCSLKHLRHLHYDNVNVDLPSLVHLSSLPDLRILGVGIDQRRVEQMSLLASSPPPFPKVSEIAISVNSLAIAVNFVRAWRFKAPTKIVRVCVDSFPSAISFRAFFEALVECDLSKSLCEIDIRHPEDQNIDEPEQNGLHGLAIKTLLVLTNLEVLKINAACSAHELDDNLLEEIAAAWPRLRFLQISWSLQTKCHSPKITLNGLAALAKCRALTDLSIAFNSRSPLHRPLNTLPQRNLQSMTFAKSSLKYRAKVIQFFAEVFPNLSSIDAYNDCGCDPEHIRRQDRRWDQMKELFRTFAGRDSGVVLAS